MIRLIFSLSDSHYRAEQLKTQRIDKDKKVGIQWLAVCCDMISHSRRQRRDCKLTGRPTVQR